MSQPLTAEQLSRMKSKMKQKHVFNDFTDGIFEEDSDFSSNQVFYSEFLIEEIRSR